MLRYPKTVALIAGVASATGFAPLEWWPVTLVALAVLIDLIGRAPSLGSALALGWWFGVGNFTLGNNWIATAFTYQAAMPAWLGWVAVVALALYLAVYPAMAAGLAWRWGRGGERALPLVFAAAWIVTEWLRATMFTGYAWNPIGVIWVPTDVLPLTTLWLGTYGLSGITVLFAGVIHDGVLSLAKKPDRRRTFEDVISFAIPIALVLFMLLPINSNEDRAKNLEGPRIRVVQPNVDQRDKDNPLLEDRNFARLARLTGAPRAEPRLILWPEAAVSVFLEEDPVGRAQVAALLGPKDVLMTGGDAWVYDRAGRLIAARNSLFVLTADGRLRGRYDKAHLVPYGEYLPMRPLLSAIGLSRLVPGDLDFLPGPGPRTFALPGFGAAGVQICYEIVFSGQVVDASHRPDFIFNPSNDAWFGAWGPPQHLAQARLRGIEEGLPIVRATPTGISAVVDADGRLLRHLPWRTAGFIDVRLPRAHAPTPFARLGNLLPFALALLLALTGVALRRRAR